MYSEMGMGYWLEQATVGLSGSGHVRPAVDLSR